MDSITITNDGSTVTLNSPYDPTMPPKAREIGGRWNAAAKAWTFDARDEQRVRDLARSIWGTDGTSDADAPTVTVRVPVHTRYITPEFRAAGQRLAWRPARDDQVRLAANVVLISGGFAGYGGSIRRPELSELDDTVLEVRDVPALQAQRIVDEVEGAEILGGGDSARAALVAEREALLARLAEINAALGEN